VPAPQRYVSWINENLGFNPRAQAHSNALCTYVDADLRRAIPTLSRDIDHGRIHWALNIDVPPGGGPRSRNIDMGYRRNSPTQDVLMAVENKTIMTAHGRARKNRLGDLLAYCMHLRAHHNEAVAGFTIVINASPHYKNPDEFSEVAKHKAILKPKELEATVDLYRKVALRKTVQDPRDAPDALSIIVIEYDGRNPARLLTELPAPQRGEPNHYDSFAQFMRERYLDRFS
jgi:hypothetical protein